MTFNLYIKDYSKKYLGSETKLVLYLNFLNYKNCEFYDKLGETLAFAYTALIYSAKKKEKKRKRITPKVNPDAFFLTVRF